MTLAVEEPSTAGPIAEAKVMARHWTGGQYSLFRVLLAAYVMAHIAAGFWQPDAVTLPSLTGPWVVGSVLLSAALSLLLAIGVADRLAALFLAVMHGWLHLHAIAADAGRQLDAAA